MSVGAQIVTGLSREVTTAVVLVIFLNNFGVVMVGVLLRSHCIGAGLLVVVAIELLHEGQALMDGNSIAVMEFLRVKNALPEAGWTLLLGYV
jgi:hypothetical protein